MIAWEREERERSPGEIANGARVVLVESGVLNWYFDY